MSDIENNDEAASYQITVVNIKYGKELANRHKDRPEIVSLDVPAALVKMKNKGNEDKFRDAVEAFACNTITRKFGAEVGFCQVYLPLEEDL